MGLIVPMEFVLINKLVPKIQVLTCWIPKIIINKSHLVQCIFHNTTNLLRRWWRFREELGNLKTCPQFFQISVSVSGFWTFLYFVSFCFLANQWSRTTPDEVPLDQGADAARAAIAFSFFSIITWVRSDHFFIQLE